MYYEDRPSVTKWMLKRAARRANLSSEEKASLADILDDRAKLAVAGSVLDDIEEDPTTVGAAGDPVGKFGDGTLLKLLFENLPAIIAAILEVLNALKETA